MKLKPIANIVIASAGILGGSYLVSKLNYQPPHYTSSSSYIYTNSNHKDIDSVHIAKYDSIKKEVIKEQNQKFKAWKQELDSVLKADYEKTTWAGTVDKLFRKIKKNIKLHT